VTLVDLGTGLWVPGVREAWGIYLNLLAFSPLVVLVPVERARSADLGAEVSAALKTGLVLTLLFSLTALVRETLGRGILTLVPGWASWPLPILKTYPLALAATGAGGFFLAAFGVVLYRTIRPRMAQIASVTEQIVPETPAPVPEPATLPPGGAAEPSGDWGESLVSVVADMGSLPGHETRRLLVIGSGNGELAYYLAMLCLDQGQGDRGFDFQVRGVDHFATRIETASRGVYREHQIEIIPPGLRQTWMVRGQGEERYLWKVGDQPRAKVKFEVADFQQGQMFFSQPSHLIVLNQGIEYVTDDKKAALLDKVCAELAEGGALVVSGPFKREHLPEGMKRTGSTVFRKG
jgi:hypothetical protein